MICVVIGQQQGFAEDGLAFAPGNFPEEIGLRVRDEVLHGFEVVAKFFDAFFPGFATRGCFGFRPIFIGQRRSARAQYQSNFG